MPGGELAIIGGQFRDGTGGERVAALLRRGDRRSVGGDESEEVDLMLEAHSGRPGLSRVCAPTLGSYPGGFK